MTLTTPSTSFPTTMQLIKNVDTYIIEESVVDPRTHTMVTRTKNLNHVRVMQVEETQTFTVHPENSKWYVPRPLSLSPRTNKMGEYRTKRAGARPKERFWSVSGGLCALVSTSATYNFYFFF